MPVDVLTENVIDRRVSRVAAHASDPANAPEWYMNIRSVEWETPPPLVVGSRLAFVAHFLGRRLAYTYEIVEPVPERRLIMRTVEGPFPMETTYTWEPAGEGKTRMTLRNRGEPRGFAKVVGLLMAHAMRRSNRKDLMTLKRVLEKGACPGPPKRRRSSSFALEAPPLVALRTPRALRDRSPSPWDRACERGPRAWAWVRASQSAAPDRGRC